MMNAADVERTNPLSNDSSYGPMGKMIIQDSKCTWNYSHFISIDHMANGALMSI